jgi:hypothetical protein
MKPGELLLSSIMNLLEKVEANFEYIYLYITARKKLNTIDSTFKDTEYTFCKLDYKLEKRLNKQNFHIL